MEKANLLPQNVNYSLRNSSIIILSVINQFDNPQWLSTLHINFQDSIFVKTLILDRTGKFLIFIIRVTLMLVANINTVYKEKSLKHQRKL